MRGRPGKRERAVTDDDPPDSDQSMKYRMPN